VDSPDSLISRVLYPVSEFPFDSIIKDHYSWKAPLSDLHLWSDEEFPLLHGQKLDQSSPVHKHFYHIFEQDSRFLETYRAFIRKVVLPLHGGDVVYQAKPTFRIHYPGNLAVGEWHKDSQYNHQREEQNWWMPFTPAFDTNTIWMESEEDKGDYKPYNVSVGEVLIFPGGVLHHGNKVNETGVSRVSMDFRVMPYEAYRATDSQSASFGMTFKIGSYYERMTG